MAPSLGTSIVSESNPRLEPGHANDEQAMAANLDLNLGTQGDTTGIALTTAAAWRKYSEDRSLDRTDLRADLTLNQNVSERVSWRASASATRDTTLTSELGTSGSARVGYRHESIGAQLQPQWRASERWTATLQLRTQREFYPSAGSGLTDFKYHSAGLVTSWARTPQDSIGIVVRTGRMSVAGAPTDIKDSSASLQYTLVFRERWNLSLAGGPAWTRGSGSTRHSENFNLELIRDAEYGAVSIAVDRALAPNGNGSLTRRDSLSLQLRRNLAAHLSGSLSARYLRSRNVVDALASGFEEVRYRRVDAGLSWSLAQQWSTVLSAGYSDQRQGADGNRASGADLALGIRWSGTSHVL
jgi:hypothetical protein